MQVCNDTFHTRSFNIGRLCGFYSHSCIGFEHKHKEVLSLCLTVVAREPYVSSLTALYYEERVFLLFILLFIKTCSRKFAIVKPTNMRKIHSRCVQNLDTTDDKISQISVGRCTSPLATVLLTEYLPNHAIVSLHYDKGYFTMYEVRENNSYRVGKTHVLHVVRKVAIMQVITFIGTVMGKAVTVGNVITRCFLMMRKQNVML